MKRRKKYRKSHLRQFLQEISKKKKWILNLFFISLNVCYKKCCIVNLYSDSLGSRIPADFALILPCCCVKLLNPNGIDGRKFHLVVLFMVN